MKKVFRATEKDQYVQPVEFDPGRYTFHAVVKGEVYSFALKTENGVWLSFDLSWQLEDGEWSRITHTFDLTEKCVEFSLFASEATSEVLIGDPMFEEGDRSTPSPHPADGFEQTRVSFDILDDKIVAEITGENGRLTKAEQTLDGIETTVYDPDTGESKITQLADEVETKVSKDGVISSINVSTEGIDINAERINFTGSVKFESAVRGEVQDDLDGLAGDIQDAQQAASDAQAKANTSKAVTDNFTTITGGLITSTMIQLRPSTDAPVTAGMSAIQGNGDGVAFWAGGSYDQAIGGAAKAIIRHDGTSKFTDTEITGKVTASTGDVGPFSISAGDLTAASGSDSMLLSSNLIRFTGQDSSVYIGADAFPASNDGAILGTQRITVNRTVTGSAQGNVGLYINITGSLAYDDEGYEYTGNHALYIPKGSISGVRFRTKRVIGTSYLSVLDTNVIVVANSTTVWLPNNPEDGQMYWINPNGYSGVTVRSYQDMWNNGGNEGTTISIQTRVWRLFIYDKVNTRWLYSWTNG